MGSSPPPLQPSSAAVFRPLDDGGVILNVETGAYYEVNPSGCFLWEQVAAGTDRDTITAALADRYDIDLATAGADVDEFLGELSDRHLLGP